MKRFGSVVALGAASALLVSAVPHGAQAADKTTLVLLAASSSRGAVGDMIAAFQKQHPDVAVQPSFAGSKVIAAEVAQGAAADVVLLAEPVARDMGGALDGITPVMRNHTAIVVAKSAEGKIHGAADLVKKGVRLGGGTPGSNIAKLDDETVAKLAHDFGADYAAKFAANVSTTKTDNAKLASSVESDSVDAAILFASDAVPGKSVAIQLPEKDRVEETHAVGVVKASAHAALARQLAAFITSSDGAAIFRAHGHDPAR